MKITCNLSFSEHGQSVFLLVDQHFSQEYPDIHSVTSSLLPNCPQQLFTVCIKHFRFTVSKDQAPHCGDNDLQIV